MKVTFGALLLSALYAGSDAAVSIVAKGDGPGSKFSVIKDPKYRNIKIWYGYADKGQVGDIGSANTPNDNTGKGMEDYNQEKIGIAAVETQKKGTSIVVIYDAPKDTTGGVAGVKLTCKGTRPDSCPGYKQNKFIEWRDDPFAIKHDEFLSEDLTYDAASDAYKTHLKWDTCCTDGYATVPIPDGDTVCVTAVGGFGVGLDKGFYVYERNPSTGGNYKTTGIKPKKVNNDLEVCIQTVVPGVQGDPHFKTWAGEKYDFHGVCDLVLLSSPSFNNNQGLDIHIRTEKTWIGSYVKSMAMRIGQDILEVMGGRHQNNFWINGVKGAGDIASDVLPNTIAGYPIKFEQVCEKSRSFVVDLGEETSVHITTWNDMVRINIVGAKEEDFGSSLGLLGTFGDGIKMARDGSTVVDDDNKFGLEWQVLPSEPNFFHNMEGPQAEHKCPVPSTSEVRRRLGRSLISEEEAKKSCSHVDEENFDLCVFDVMSTNDHDAAGAY